MLSRSAIQVAKVALAVATRVLPTYRSKFARQDFTEPQKVACLLIQRFYRLDYRGIEQLLREHQELRRALGLRRVPDHTTLCRALTHLSDEHLEALLDETVRRARRLPSRRRRQRRRTVIPDSTGLRSDRASRYFFRRVGNRHWNRRWPKWSIAVDLETHVILSQIASHGPHSDHIEFKPLIAAAQRRRRSELLIADAGYDSEANHVWCWEQGTEPIIKVKTRCGAKGRRIMGDHRRAIYHHFPRRQYGQRWQVESTFSAHKRRFGDDLRSNAAPRRLREILLRGVLHNCAILPLPSLRRGSQQSN
jgi:hypothetical protein